MSGPARAPRIAVGTPLASLLLSAYVLVFFNAAFWRRLWLALSPVDASDCLLVAAIGGLLLGLVWSLLNLVGWGRATRPAWALFVLLAAVAAYFMDTYGLMIDRAAVQSVFETDAAEAGEWMSWRMAPYLLGAAIPAVLMARVRLVPRGFRRELGAKLAIVGGTAAAFVLAIVFAFQPRPSLARNHRELRHLVNPVAAIQSTYGYSRRRWFASSAQRATVGADAQVGASWQRSARPRVLVLVVGESARASSFGTLGYSRDTTPRLSASDVFAFSNVHSCGTSTAVSLPCMFSDLGAAGYSDSLSRGRETLLDVLRHAGLSALWLDNNTGSKDVAHSQQERRLARATDPRRCNADGCFDDILVDELEQRLAQGSIPPLIVLHQKGSHGPSYFERYPPDFKRFVPTCDSNELGDCSAEQIVNTYDNTILYTDHTLGRVIDVLRANAPRVDSAMLYVSDHGESTGEHGLFLHGAPSFMAPAEQTHIPMFLWLSDAFASRIDIDRGCLDAGRDTPLSHDNLFHSVLGLLDVRTGAYRRELDISSACRGASRQRLAREGPGG